MTMPFLFFYNKKTNMKILESGRMHEKNIFFFKGGNAFFIFWILFRNFREKRVFFNTRFVSSSIS
jgi:hypothetical protein